jgi:hypothetical protein
MLTSSSRSRNGASAAATSPRGSCCDQVCCRMIDGPERIQYRLVVAWACHVDSRVERSAGVSALSLFGCLKPSQRTQRILSLFGKLAAYASLPQRRLLTPRPVFLVDPATSHQVRPRRGLEHRAGGASEQAYRRQQIILYVIAMRLKINFWPLNDC